MLTPSNLWTHWHLDLWLLLPLLIVIALFVRGLLRMGHRPNSSGMWRILACVAGLVTLAVTVISPFDQLTSMLLTAHMVQYTLLTVLVPVLLVVGRVWDILLSGLPDHLAEMLRARGSRTPLARQAWAFLSRPLAVGLIDVGALLGWHLPGIYESALTTERLHALELGSFLVAGLLSWRLVQQPSRGSLRGYAATLVFLVSTSLIGMGFGFVLFNSGTLWYPIYQDRTLLWGIRSLVDQQIAGVILGLGPESFDIVPFLLVLAALLQAEERLEPDPAPARGDD